jgi:hypothetical protein
MDPAVASFLTVVGSGIAAYAGAYFKKRGEDRAIEDGFAQVLRQTKETTQATKAIEARITDEVWDRQKRWELKRDILLEAIKRSAALDEALNTYRSFVDLDIKRAPQGPELDTHWAQQNLETKRTWNKASADFDETRAIVEAICSSELKLATDNLGIFAAISAARLAKGDSESWAEVDRGVFYRIKNIQVAIRRELGLEVTSQSNESSAAPIPAPPNPEAK